MKKFPILSNIKSLNDSFNRLSETESIPSTNVASGAFATLARITVPANGYYLLDADLSFDPGTGIRILMVDVSETDANSAINSVLAEGRATMQKIRMLRLTTSDTIYIRAYQNTGSTMSIGGSYRLLRLR